jgi:PAS domain S-box-containing protein
MSVSELERQRAQLRSVIDGMPGLVSYVDRTYTYRFVNAGYSQWLGRAAGEVEGKTVRDILGAAAEAELLPYMERAFAGEPLMFERRLQCIDMIRDVRVRYAPQRGPGGEVEGLIALVFDITEQRQAEQAREASESRFRQIVEMASEGIWMVDPDARTTFLNPRMTELLGLPAEQIHGRPWYDFIHPEDRERGFAGFERRKQGDTQPREYRVVRPDGSTVWLDFTASPIRDHAGNVTGVMAMCTDVTERRLAQDQMQQTQKLESLGVLAGGIAHDFNNLLVGILGNASLAADVVGIGSPAQPMLADLMSAAERAAKLTRQLLSYAGRDARKTGAVSFNSMVSEMAQLLKAAIPRNVELALELDEDSPATEGDEAQLQQIVMNLVINAAEAIPEGRAGRVRVTTETREVRAAERNRAVIPLKGRSDRYVVLTVTDDGCGMDESTRARIFDPFFTTKFAGRGLGLSAVLGIIKAHAGTLVLDTEPGKGTTFRVFLRTAARRVPEPVTAPEIPRYASTTAVGTVLVVDDEAPVRDVAVRALETSGYEAIAVNDGAEAIEAVIRHPEIDVVLLDLAMPKMTGDRAAPEIRRARPEIRILLSSGYAEQEARERFRNVRLDGFLQKPYTARALIRALRASLAAEA